MKLNVKSGLLVCASGFGLLVSGCSGGNWLIGKWELDKGKTMEAFAADKRAGRIDGEPRNDLEKAVGGFFKAVGRGLTGALLDQFADSTVEFTRTEVRTIRSEKGSSRSYKIIDRPDSGTLVIQFSDGDITTWHREDGYIKQNFGGEGSVWLYFKRVTR